jgi:DNA ligase-1
MYSLDVLQDMTDKYPDVVAILPQICKFKNQSFIIDAEIVAIDNEGNIQPFSTLSNRARKNVAIEDITINVVSYNLFFLSSHNI